VDDLLSLFAFNFNVRRYIMAPGKRLRVHCGSPSYAAPEIVGRKAGLTFVHFSAQLERFSWDRGCT
jgi:hypothetical protein